MQVCARLRGGRGWVGFGATEESSSIKGLARAISYGRYQVRAVPPLLMTLYLRTAVVPSQRPPIELRDAAGDSSIGVLRDTLASESR